MTDNQTPSLKNILWLSGIILLALFLISAYVWLQIPAGEQVCTHWNAAGECDQYGSKFMGIFLMPLVAAAVIGLFVVIPRIEPRAIHLAQSFYAYRAIWIAMLLFFLLLHILLMLEILGTNVNIATVLPIILGLFFIVIGRYLRAVRSNFFFGIRTPWTLSSELAWTKTHQLGGWLFMLLGLFFIISALFSSGALWVYVMLGSILVMLIVLMAYSYYVWKNDPDAHRS